MKKIWKLTLSSVIGSVIVAGTVWAQPNLQLFINGQGQDLGSLKLKVENGVTMVSLRSIIENLKGDILIDENKNSINVVLPDSTNLLNQVQRLERDLQPITAEGALQTWIRGIQDRNGAVQYAVFSPDLREKTKKNFDESYWVTGGSSPHMGKVENIVTRNVNDTTVQFTFDYPLIDKSGTIGVGKAVITVQKMKKEYKDGWFITNIKMKNPEDTGIMIGAEKL
ncbi:hypothetical protein [Brevibacillus halotolerans]|uniref:hypothetical protein n=1 Tax=Brevibacillus halotolerans TaxID=1507437 RepID=UPI0015EF88EB|nr:hypothetical protein [Brevibacillus halotolerans]MBA4532658.1 hypothetical protein [Brevibacillus halotolerans]